MAELIDKAPGIEGLEYALYRSGDEYIIRVNGYELMTSYCHGSEEKLALSTFENIKSANAPRVLVGGLGMGFTLRTLLDLLPLESAVDVSEIEPSVIRWNRSIFRNINGNVLSDPRVNLHESDVAVRITGPELYDAIILDIDNGPHPLSAPGNSWLYSDEGIACIYGSLKTTGVFTLWSAFMDKMFLERLESSEFKVIVEHTFSNNNRSSGEYIIYKGLKMGN